MGDAGLKPGETVTLVWPDGTEMRFLAVDSTQLEPDPDNPRIPAQYLSDEDDGA